MGRIFLQHALMTAWVAASMAPAQSPSGPTAPPAAISQQPFLEVQSDLVQVSVFVFAHNALEQGPTQKDWDCLEDQQSAFIGLSPDSPYLPRSCDAGQVKDLAPGDFRLFQDGKLQKILSVEKEQAWLSSRDNWGWHNEISDSPMGFWSTADLGKTISPESMQFYLLRYMPSEAPSVGGCHQIRVEVSRPQVRVFARDEYCLGQTPTDLLNGTKEGNKLDRELPAKGHGRIPLSIQVHAFGDYGPLRRVEIVAAFPWERLNHSWDPQWGRLYADIEILGIVYAKDGRPQARFSDRLYPAYWPAIIKGEKNAAANRIDVFVSDPAARFREYDPAWLPTRYETQLQLPPGKYTLRVVLSDGEKVGRAESSLTIDSFDGKSLALGSIFLCNRFRNAHVATVETTAANFAPQYVPLISKGVRFTPAAKMEFSVDEKLFAYFEIHRPQSLAGLDEGTRASMKLLNAVSGQVVKDIPAPGVAGFEQHGNPVVPVASEIPIANLPKGEYRLEIQASDAAGDNTTWKMTDFTIVGKLARLQDSTNLHWPQFAEREFFCAAR
jgi:hypothetical protein